MWGFALFWTQMLRCLPWLLKWAKNFPLLSGEQPWLLTPKGWKHSLLILYYFYSCLADMILWFYDTFICLPNTVLWSNHCNLAITSELAETVESSSPFSEVPTSYYKSLCCICRSQTFCTGRPEAQDLVDKNFAQHHSVAVEGRSLQSMFPKTLSDVLSTQYAGE